MSDSGAEIPQEINELIEEITGTVRDQLAAAPDRPDLQLTGLEGIVITLSLKAGVGAVSAFVGGAAFDRWRSARTRRQLRELAVSLDLRNASTTTHIDQSDIEHELTAQLLEQGLTAKQAQRIVTKAMDGARTRIALRKGGG